MAADPEVQIQPKDGKWVWTRLENGKPVSGGENKDRTEAIAEAREAAGAVTTDLFRKDKNGEVKPFGTARTPGCRVALMWEDGSEYGELDPPPSSATGPPQIVNIEPAAENGEAAKVETRKGKS